MGKIFFFSHFSRNVLANQQQHLLCANTLGDVNRFNLFAYFFADVDMTTLWLLVGGRRKLFYLENSCD